MELRERRRCRTSTSSWPPRRLVVACRTCFAVAAVVATKPAIAHVATPFMAGGAPGNGEAAPGDHLQSDYRLWLAGRRLEHGRAPWIDPYSFQPEAGSPGNAVLVALRAGLPSTGRSTELLGPVLAWNVFTLLAPVRRRRACDALAASSSNYRCWRPPHGGLAFEIAPYGHPRKAVATCSGRRRFCSPLALWAFERARATGRLGLVARSRGQALASIPLSGQVHLALGGAFSRALRPLPVDRAARQLVGTAVGRGPGRGARRASSSGRPVIAGSIDSSEGDGSPRWRVYSATGLDFLSRSTRHGVRGLRLSRLADAARWRSPGSSCSCSDASLRLPARPGRGRSSAGLPRVRHAHPALLARSGTSSLRSATRACRSGCCPIACLCDRGAGRSRGRLGAPADGGAAACPRSRSAAIVAVLLLADLHVRAFHPSAADA